MAIEFIGASGVSATSMTLPTHQSGDIVVMFAYRNGNNTAPALPATWSGIGATGGNTNSSRLAYKFVTSGNTPSNTWTNATQLIAHVYRGCAGVGGFAGSSQSNSSTITYPTLTMENGNGRSIVVGFAGHRTATNVELAPAGMANRASAGTGPEAAGHDTETGVTSWSATNVTVNATAASRSWTLELKSEGVSIIS
jgi:hypothetical protein